MNNELERLQDCADQGDLRLALHSLCSRFGAITRLDILMASQGGQRQALCFLRLESDEQERELMNELGVGRFGGDLVVVVDLHPHESSAANPGATPLRPDLGREPIYHTR